MNRYIDVRGVHPVYINGLIAIVLTGASRGITVSEVERDMRWDDLKLNPSQFPSYQEFVIKWTQ